MADKNFLIKNGLTVGSTERISSAGVITGSLSGSLASATTATTQSASDNSTKIATTAYTDAAITALVDSSPGALNTLNELAAALGDDASFSTTVTNSIATKAPLATPQFTNRVGIGVAAHGTAALNITSTAQHMRLNNGSELGIISLLSTGELELWGHGDGESINFRTGSGTGTVAMNVVGDKVGIGDPVPQDYLEINGSGSGLGGLTISNSSHNHAALSFARSSTATARIFTTEPDALHTSSMNFQTSNASGSSPNLVTAMVIRENQYVGIGTTNPLGKFVVSNGGAEGFEVFPGSASGQNSFQHYNRSGSAYLRNRNIASEFTFNLSGATDDAVTFKAGGNVGIGTNNPGVTLDVDSTEQNVFRLDTTNSDGPLQIFRNNGNVRGYIGNAEGILGKGVTNFGIRAQANLYFGTGGNNTRMTILSGGNVGIGFDNPGQTLSVNGTIGIGTNASVGIGSTMADANIAELGPGYLNLARDDTADAKQISFSKNGVRVSDISTTDKGILWEVLESSGNAAAFQVTNGVGHTVWGSMNAQGHKWQDNVYNAFSAGGMSMGTDSSNTSHMWWNTYDTGSKHGVSAGYGMDEYVSNSTGHYTIRMSDNSSFVGDGVVLTERYRFDNGGALNIYGAGSQNASNDGKLYVEKNSNSDWSIKAAAGADDYGIYTKGNGSYAYAAYNHNSSAYKFRVNYDGTIYAVNTTVQSISDRRLKENIVDANSQWDDIKALKWKNYSWKESSGHKDGNTYLGLIADEVKAVSPNLVEVEPQSKEDIEAGVENPSYENVKYSVVWLKAMKALQEAMARIETLETKLEAAEARIATLEG